MFNRIIIFAVIFLITPIVILAQAGEAPLPDSTSSPQVTEAPGSTVSDPGTSVPMPTAATSVSRTASPAPTLNSSPTPSFTPLISSTPPVSPDPASSADEPASIVILVLVGAGAAAVTAYVGLIFMRNSTKNKKDKNKCDSIKDLLEQKRKELEDMVRNWPEEKIKEMAKKAVLEELKKDENAKIVIDTAESAKAKYDKLREAIEILQKRYDLCMLELPSLGKVKILKFKAFKAEAILEGKKTATIRLFDDKDLKVGDNLELMSSDDKKIFAKAVITDVICKNLGEVDAVDLDGHEKWDNKEEMLESFKKYYGDSVNLNTPAKIVRFKLVADKH